MRCFRRQSTPSSPQKSSLTHQNHAQISGLLYNDGHAIVFNSSARFQLLAMSLDKSVEPSFGASLATNQPTRNLTRRNTGQADYQQSNVLSGGGYPNGLPAVRSTKTHQQIIATADEPTLNGLRGSVELSIGQASRLEAATMEDNNNLIEPSLELAKPSNQLASEIEVDENELGAGTDQLPGDESYLVKVQFTGAGLNGYSYRFEALYLRFGASNGKLGGSEHQVNSRSFAAELQLVAYNSHLYKSFQEASGKPGGLLAISVLIDMLPDEQQPATMTATTTTTTSSTSTSKQTTANEQLETLLGQLASLGHRGASVPVKGFNVSALLPETDHFVAYEGSLTFPGCHEGVHWLVLNKPLYTSKQNVSTISLSFSL